MLVKRTRASSINRLQRRDDWGRDVELRADVPQQSPRHHAKGVEWPPGHLQEPELDGGADT